jgi:hypothetical protein
MRCEPGIRYQSPKYDGGKAVNRERNAKHPAKVLTFSRGRAAGPFRRDLQRSAPGPPHRAADPGTQRGSAGGQLKQTM